LNLKSYKQNKARGASIQEVIDSLQLSADKMESIAVVVIYSDDEIETAYSGDSDVELIGMLEVAKLN